MAEETETVQNLKEAEKLGRLFFKQQGNPEEFTIGPNDLAKLLGFAVLGGRKMEGMPNEWLLNEAVGKEISSYAWMLTKACFQACDPPAQGICF
jgi:hypothetical protein